MSSAARRKELEAKINELKDGYLKGEESVVKSMFWCFDDYSKLKLISHKIAFRWDSDERSLNIRLVVGEESFRFCVYIPEDFPDMRPMVSIDSEGDDDELSVSTAFFEKYWLFEINCIPQTKF